MLLPYYNPKPEVWMVDTHEGGKCWNLTRILNFYRKLCVRSTALHQYKTTPNFFY